MIVTINSGRHSYTKHWIQRCLKMDHRHSLLAILVNLVCVISGIPSTSTTTEPPLPPEINVCIDLVYKCNNKNQFSHEKIDHICSVIANENGDGYMITPEDVDFFLGLLNDMVNKAHRNKRRAYYRKPVRREVRKMTAWQWKRFTKAMNELKKDGTYDRLAAIHRGFDRLNSAHGGPAFLSWHRIYLLVLEHALQIVSRSGFMRYRNPVTIPYWDSRLDYDMGDPTESILWKEKLFGNGHGKVETGPFVWKTGQGEDLMRNIGSGGSLIRHVDFKNVLTRRKHSEIINPRHRQYWLEGFHNGPHVWVDGQMSLLSSAAEEPVFWLHHCFIDYWWQKFMNQQLKRGVNPFDDYPDAPGNHSASVRMDPFNITNREGYSQFWYNYFYRYEDSPATDCSRWQNTNCNSRYLQCNFTIGRCVSKKARTSHRESSVFGSGIFSSDKIPLLQPNFVFKTSAEEMPKLRMGRRFQSSIVDPRTTGKQLKQAPALLAHAEVTSDVGGMKSVLKMSSSIGARSSSSSVISLNPLPQPSIEKYLSFLKIKSRIAKRSVKYANFESYDTKEGMCKAVNNRIREVA